MTKYGGFGHLGGTFSCVEMLISLYYSNLFSFSKTKDFFILSKGHANLALLSILKDKKIISKKFFLKYGKNSGIGGQLDKNINGVYWNTGSLGHSIGVCAGVALANKLKKKNYYAITIIGDSEIDEGASWEAIMHAGQNKLNNLIVMIDRNKFSVTTKIDNSFFYKNPKSIISKLGWNVYEVEGHNISKIKDTLKIAKNSKRPNMIICNTIKGKGVSFMENNKGWHHGSINSEQFKIAMKDLEKNFG